MTTTRSGIERPGRPIADLVSGVPVLARRLALCVSGAALALSAHAFGVGDHVLIAGTTALVAVLTGVAADRLLSQDARVLRLEQRLAALEQEIAAMRTAAPGTPRRAPNESPRSAPALPPGASVATIAQRPGIVFSDGTVLVQTLAGYRQFASVADAQLYLGTSRGKGSRLAS